MAPNDFLRLLVNSRCLIGNSSAGIRECAYLGVPVVNIGSRQVGRERAQNVVEATHDRTAIMVAVSDQLSHGSYSCDPIYGEGSAGEQIADVLENCPLTIEKRLTF